MRTHNHGIDPSCREIETPEGLIGECMFVAEPPSRVKGLATEEEPSRIQDRIKLAPGTEFRYKVASVLQEIQDLLVVKNEAYGNAALDPVNIFSKSTAVEQIKIRIDDKLSRLYHGKEYGDEDTITDLLGYIVLLKIAEREADNDTE